MLSLCQKNWSFYLKFKKVTRARAIFKDPCLAGTSATEEPLLLSYTGYELVAKRARVVD